MEKQNQPPKNHNRGSATKISNTNPVMYKKDKKKVLPPKSLMKNKNLRESKKKHYLRKGTYKKTWKRRMSTRLKHLPSSYTGNMIFKITCTMLLDRYQKQHLYSQIYI